MKITVSGETLRVGDWVCFKYGVDRCGEIVEASIVSGRVILTIVYFNSDEEEIYVDKFEDECWLE
jgi:hypothetical protein